MLSLKKLGFSEDVVTCLKMKDAPEELQGVDLSGTAKHVWIVPTSMLPMITIHGATYSLQIRGGYVFVS